MKKTLIILVALGMVFVSLPAAAGNDFDEMIQIAAEEMNRQLPIDVDGNATLDRVLYDNGVLVYYAHFNQIDSRDLDATTSRVMREAMQQMMKRLAATNEAIQWLLKNGISIKYNVYDMHDRFVTTIILHADNVH